MKTKTHTLHCKTAFSSLFLPHLHLYKSKAILSRVTPFSLTLKPVAPILNILSAHVESNGIGLSFCFGFQSRISRGFFMPSEKYHVMVGCIGESQDSPLQSAVDQPDTVRHPMIGLISCGSNLLSFGVTAMSQKLSFSDELIKVLHELKSEIQSLKAELRALKDNAAVSEPTHSNESACVKAEIAHTLGVKPHELPAQLSPAQTAQVLNVKTATLSVWRCVGRGLPFVKTGKSPFYRVKDIIAFMLDRYFSHTGLPMAGGVA